MIEIAPYAERHREGAVALIMPIQQTEFAIPIALQAQPDLLDIPGGAHGFRSVYLGTTEAFRAAHRFYEKNGFSEIEKGELPPAFPVMPVDSRFYRLVLERTGAGLRSASWPFQ